MWFTVCCYRSMNWRITLNTSYFNYPFSIIKLFSIRLYPSWAPEFTPQFLSQLDCTLPGHLSSPPVFSGVCVTQSLVLCVCFVDHCLSFCTFSFGHCFVCSSLIYVFWLICWYLQTLLRCSSDGKVTKGRNNKCFTLYIFYYYHNATVLV